MLCSFLVLPLLTHGKRMSDCNSKESMHTCEANKTRQVIAQRLIDRNGFSWTGELVACAKISVWILLLLTVVYIAGCGYNNHPRDSFYHHVSRMHRGWEKIRGDACLPVLTCFIARFGWWWSAAFQRSLNTPLLLIKWRYHPLPLSLLALKPCQRASVMFAWDFHFFFSFYSNGNLEL